ncbi:hypothetical protein CGSHi6P18H1_06491 [Haemophilus influenzae 6P18H1]|nr:hypothetical protein CGSHi6P18H1_06491 [Haemophilus influenzae 6P18H1]
MLPQVLGKASFSAAVGGYGIRCGGNWCRLHTKQISR